MFTITVSEKCNNIDNPEAEFLDIIGTMTINVPVVFMARYVMVLWGATSLQGALEGLGT